MTFIQRRCAAPLACFSMLLPWTAQAHSFGVIYNLPVPFWLYAYGATAALVLSFLVVAFFAAGTLASEARPGRVLLSATRLAALRRFKPWVQLVSVLLLLLCLATGFFGHRNPYQNFNMTFFWIVCVLGIAYLSALLGNLYGLLNPWRALADGIGRIWPGFVRGRWQLPAAFGSWPALLLYMAFIWVELFASIRPYSLATLLAGYTVFNLLGVWCVGARDWFTRCEFFGLLFGLIARMAPLHRVQGALRWRLPCSGLLQERAADFSVLLFILFMLSSTAFDGLKATLPWMKLFWHDPFNVLTPQLGGPPLYFYAQLQPWYERLEVASLLLSPLLYLAAYALCLALAKAITRSPLTLRELMLRFAYSLLPIALVYNVTHYYTLLLTQGITIFSLVSDPFGWGWNLFGTARQWRTPILPSMDFVWHSQVALILIGHVVSVVLAHIEALRCFGSRRLALLSQLPMLLLMVAFTTAGLWILSQPLQAGH